ncbi:MAG TPA: hypothetical protein DCW60_04485, partial [Sutterella sp.]|nr:hypothetical protein [Sutterella sp.]
ADYCEEVRQRVLDFKKRFNLEVPMYTPNAINLPVCICSPNPKEREDAVSYLKSAIDVANGIECPRVLVVCDHPGYQTPRREIWKYAVASLKELCAYARPRGVDVTLEPLTPMESPIVATVDDCVAMIEDVDDPALYCMMDIVPPTITKEPLSKYFKMLGDRLNYIHICNTDGITDAHTRLGEGILPVADIIRIFKMYGWEGFVTAELYSELFYDPEQMLSNTNRFLKDACAEFGIENHLV